MAQNSFDHAVFDMVYWIFYDLTKTTPSFPALLLHVEE
ncbi:hypothetical protein NPIRD3C_0983 [Nitrosopumilus piranensis]|uniref:Uncharacterized protein n=1 Tax=Nitrosopumilus piranensis TaxID=1582439 RepID=A0A0C5BYY0_9ARCH|nr:hypothetical protein NPIRD3C_0983 [Nitrosopumilus piranensis]